jgi:hypothetical protein
MDEGNESRRRHRRRRHSHRGRLQRGSLFDQPGSLPGPSFACPTINMDSLKSELPWKSDSRRTSNYLAGAMWPDGRQEQLECCQVANNVNCAGGPAVAVAVAAAAALLWKRPLVFVRMRVFVCLCVRKSQRASLSD